jgi:3-keto steroid reductase
MSSHEASLICFNLEDWQAKTTGFSYQSSKYQIDLLATHLDRLSLKQVQQPSSEARVIRHFVTYPGVCITNVDKERSGLVTNALKVIFFYVVRVAAVNQSLRILLNPLCSVVSLVR